MKLINTYTSPLHKPDFGGYLHTISSIVFSEIIKLNRNTTDICTLDQSRKNKPTYFLEVPKNSNLKINVVESEVFHIPNL